MTSPSPATPASPHLPDVDQATDWRAWQEGLAEAREHDRPILCLAEPAWANGSQRLALVLGRDESVRQALETRFVPVRLDPLARPDVADRLRCAALSLTGTAGPPLLVLLTPTGLPFLAYCTIRPEGGDGYPSLAALLRSVADLHHERPEAVHEEAEALRARLQPSDEGIPPAPRSWDGLAGVADDRFGGLHELPKHPRPSLLWSLLDEAENPAAREHLVLTLSGMHRGGILDQLAGSFHRCSRDERWVVPHFEKLVPQNAALAAVYARAGKWSQRDEYLDVAKTAAAFAMAGLDEGVMALGSDPPFHTWTPPQFQEALDPVLVQALGLHVNITRDASPHVLFRAMEPDEVAEHTSDAPEVLARRIELGKERLRFTRFQRPSPAAVRIDAPAWHAETLRWLFRAARHVELDEGRLLGHLDDLLARSSTPEGVYERSDGRGGAGHWLEDQVAVAAACTEAAATAAHQPAADEAHRLADVILDRYLHVDGRHLVDRPGAPAEEPSRAHVDHFLPAAVPTAVEVLGALAHMRGRRAASYARAARSLAATQARAGRGARDEAGGVPTPGAEGS